MSSRATAEFGGAVRWRLWLWPAAIGLALVVAGLAWVWTADYSSRQDPITRTLVIVAGGALAETAWFLLWLLWLSRLAWTTRLAATAAVAALLALAALAVRVQGFSGDVLPQLSWRWRPAPGELPAVGPRATGSPPTAATSDYPQFLGDRRDATLRDVRLAGDWAARPPRRLWRQPIGAGWSGFAVVGGRAVTMEQRGDQELVSCYDVLTGALLWARAETARFDNALGGPGPRATPAIRDGRVYALGATGKLRALDLGNGDELWSTDAVVDAGAEIPTYGVSASPLAWEDLVLATAGGGGATLLAYDAASGEPRWTGGRDQPGNAYSSPMAATIDGVPQILLLNGSNLAAHDPGTGAMLWSRPWSGQTERASQPVVFADGRVFASSGYGIGGKMFRVRRDAAGSWQVDLLWESLALKAKFANVVQHAGFLYGLDDGILAAVDAENGRRRWKGGRYGHGQIVLVSERILVLAENGEVALVDAVPDAFRERGRFPAIEGKTWGHPALAGRYLLVRNDREAACYEMPLGD